MSAQSVRICCDGRVRSSADEVLGLEHLGEEPERAQRVPQIVHEHRDVIAPLRLEQCACSRNDSSAARTRARSSRESMGFVRYASAPFAQPRLDRVRLASRGRQHDAPPGPRRDARAAVEHLDAVHPRHRHVEQHELRLALVDLLQRVVAAQRRAHPVAVVGEERLVEGERVGEVVDDEHVAAVAST